MQNKLAICASCASHIDVINQKSTCHKCGRYSNKNICYFCLKYTPCFTRAKSYCNYEDVVAKIIKNYKYYNNTRCRNFMINKIRKVFEEEFANKDIHIDCIIPVPMNSIKEYIKGYNHAAQIARLVFQNTKYPVLPFALKKKFIMKKQAGSFRTERLQNMENIFYTAKKYELYNKNVLLIDDIITTSATVNECAKALFQKNVKNVYVLTFAKSIRDEELIQENQET